MATNQHPAVDSGKRKGWHEREEATVRPGAGTQVQARRHPGPMHHWPRPADPLGSHHHPWHGDCGALVGSVKNVRT